MQRKNVFRIAAAGSACLALLAASSSPLGVFEGSTDVGELLHAGSAEYDASARTYTLTGSGENMWFAKDDFHYVWKKISAKDVDLAADISLPGEGGDDHRKGVLMIRQSLDPDAAYADLARHGNGLTSLQFRAEKGAVTHEVEASLNGPGRLRIEKHGDLFYMFVGNPGQEITFAGGSTRVRLHAPFYVGLGVCSHNKANLQKAVFSNVELNTDPAKGPAKRYSTLETVAVASTDALVAYIAEERLGAPTWSADGGSLLFRKSGKWQKVAVTGGSPEQASSGRPSGHTYPARTSPDATQKASLSGQRPAVLSVITVAGKKSKAVATLPAGGALSSHPWSPDGKKLAFVSYQSVP